MNSVNNQKKYVEDIYPVSDSSDSEEEDCVTAKPRFTPLLPRIEEQFEMHRTSVTQNSQIVNKNLEKIKEN